MCPASQQDQVSCEESVDTIPQSGAALTLGHRTSAAHCAVENRCHRES